MKKKSEVNKESVYEDNNCEEFDDYIWKKLKECEDVEKAGKTIWLTHDQVFNAIREELNLN